MITRVFLNGIDMSDHLVDGRISIDTSALPGWNYVEWSIRGHDGEWIYEEEQEMSEVGKPKEKITIKPKVEPVPQVPTEVPVESPVETPVPALEPVT